MISSIIWLYLAYSGVINPDSAPWGIYIPIAGLEVVVCWLALPKIADWLDKRRGNKNV